MNRDDEIIKLLSSQGIVHVNTIAEHFGVTPTSIRRDLARMEAAGAIRRTHGHAQLESPSGIPDFQRRGVLRNEEKRRIAKAALRLVENSQAVYLDSGTTALALAEELAAAPREGVTVITSSLPVATMLAARYRVLMPGGLVLADDMSLIGPETDTYLRSITTDLAFLGATGVRSGVGLTASSPFLVSIKKQVIATTRQAVILVDSSKFSQNGVHLFASFSEMNIHTLITVKTDANGDALSRIEQMGIRVIPA